MWQEISSERLTLRQVITRWRRSSPCQGRTSSTRARSKTCGPWAPLPDERRFYFCGGREGNTSWMGWSRAQRVTTVSCRVAAMTWKTSTSSSSCRRPLLKPWAGRARWFSCCRRPDQARRIAARAAEALPLVDTEVFAQLLHVGDQVLGGVELHIGGRVARVGRASAASGLIEEDDPLSLRIEGLAGPAEHPGPWPPCTTRAGLPSGLPHAFR